MKSAKRSKKRLRFFDLLNFDFLLDTDIKIWLLEINVNPAIHTNCEVLKNLLPPVIEETLDIVLEIFDKSKKRQPIMPLSNQRHYQTLYDDTSGGSVPAMRPPTRKAMASTQATAANPNANGIGVGATGRPSPRNSVSPAKGTTKSPLGQSAVAGGGKSGGRGARERQRLPVATGTPLRKNVTPLSTPVVQLQHGPSTSPAVVKKNENGVREVTSKVNGIKL